MAKSVFISVYFRNHTLRSHISIVLPVPTAFSCLGKGRSLNGRMIMPIFCYQPYVTCDWLMPAHTGCAGTLSPRERKPIRQMASVRIKIRLQSSFILFIGTNETYVKQKKICDVFSATCMVSEWILRFHLNQN